MTAHTVHLVAGPHFAASARIATNMRARDKEEIFALAWKDDPWQLAARTAGLGDFQWTAFYDHEPVAAIGAFPVWPGVWNVWAYGTDLWPKVAITLTRHVKTFMIPAILERGAHRAHCYVLDKNDDAARWLEYLGAVKEASLDNFGKNGQTFHVYSWGRNTTKGHTHVPRR